MYARPHAPDTLECSVPPSVEVSDLYEIFVVGLGSNGKVCICVCMYVCMYVCGLGSNGKVYMYVCMYVCICKTSCPRHT